MHILGARDEEEEGWLGCAVCEGGRYFLMPEHKQVLGISA